MGNKLYVGNLGYEVSDQDLQQLFATHGAVDSAKVVMDPASGKSKGFGFVEMSNSAEAQTAINTLNGKDFGGRAIKVNEAKPRPERTGGGGGGRNRW